MLARTITGIGFRTADMVAEKLGIPRNSIQRARAAVVYLLERMAEEGHVFAPFGYLEHQFGTGLEMDPQLAARRSTSWPKAASWWPRISAATIIRAIYLQAACTTPRPRSRSGFGG